MTKWMSSVPERGDLIRIKRPRYYHYGIYMGNGEVVHFAAEGSDGITEPDTVKVRKSSMEHFTEGGMVEVRAWSLSEKLRKNSREKTAIKALEAVGEGGYNLLNNNCEHFAMRCVFGK